MQAVRDSPFERERRESRIQDTGHHSFARKRNVCFDAFLPVVQPHVLAMHRAENPRDKVARARARPASRCPNEWTAPSRSCSPALQTPGTGTRWKEGQVVLDVLEPSCRRQLPGALHEGPTSERQWKQVKERRTCRFPCLGEMRAVRTTERNTAGHVVAQDDSEVGSWDVCIQAEGEGIRAGVGVQPGNR